MTAKAAMAKALLLGQTISVRVCYRWFGISNCSREVIRCIEKPFGVVCDRKEMKGVSRYGRSCEWTDYKLTVFSNSNNHEGLVRMIKYVIKQEGEPRTEKDMADRKKLEMILTFLQ